VSGLTDVVEHGLRRLTHALENLKGTGVVNQTWLVRSLYAELGVSMRILFAVRMATDHLRYSVG